MSEQENVTYPSIDPSVFDLIVVRTGLPKSIIAATASVAGKTVLHVDSNSFYGSYFSSLSLDDFTSFLYAQKTQSETTLPHSSVVNGNSDVDRDKDYVIINLKPKSLYSDIEVSSLPEEESVKSYSIKFNLDLSGPRVMFCADSVVDLLLNSGGKHHIEFKGIDGSFIYGANGELSAKNQLMRFFKLVQAHIEGSTEHAEDSDESRRIRDEDLESPFIEFLSKQRLPSKIKSMILFAIAMADYDQEKRELCKNLLKTKDGIESLALFHSSVGKYTNALGEMIYPIYGQGELPQAFSRCAAVLRLPVIDLLLSKENGDCKGVRLASGQEILSQHLVINPSVTGPSPPFLPRAPNFPEKCSESDDQGKVIEKVARGICIISGLIKSDLSNLLNVSFSPSFWCLPNFDSLISILQASSGGGITSCPAPYWNLDYRNILESSEKLFHQIYQEEFFPKTSASEKTEDADDET
ncbi:hypothetical protein MKX03_009485 [Papaver bracteatum]|nr:hypothetical protein MKX03_009485 [Papaver bracteatum]